MIILHIAKFKWLLGALIYYHTVQLRNLKLLAHPVCIIIVNINQYMKSNDNTHL